MRTIGLIGGMSWESSAEYYRLLNQGAREALGGASSARLVLHSFDFAEIAALQHAGDWPGLEARMTEAAMGLARAGAELLVICTNTMHLFADAVAAASGLELVHIADATGAAVAAAGLERVALLGTRFTMEQPFYRDRLAAGFGIEVTVPGPADRAHVHRVIYDELVAGRIEDASRTALAAIVARCVQGGAGADTEEGAEEGADKGADKGAQDVVLGCTELPLLLGEDDAAVPMFDTTRLHAQAALAAALAG